MAIPPILGTEQNIFAIGRSSNPGKRTLRFRNSTATLHLEATPTVEQTIDLIDLIDSTKRRKSLSIIAGRNFALTDANRFLICLNTTAITLTVPAISWEIDTEIEVLQWGTGQVTIVADSGVTITRLGGTTHALSGKGAVGLLKLITTNDWLLLGSFV
jgi:hypothetical protein